MNDTMQFFFARRDGSYRVTRNKRTPIDNFICIYSQLNKDVKDSRVVSTKLVIRQDRKTNMQ